MQVSLGIKSDPIEYRYSFDWLFELMNELGIRYLQLGSFPELYTLEDGFFLELRERAEEKNVVIKSCFTAHRELGGFFSGNPYLERAARRNYEHFIHAASLLGADSLGGNAGSVYRDRMEQKAEGIECYLSHMKELMALAHKEGLKSLHVEPMSCLAEPPTLPEELDYMLGTLNEYHRKNPESTVPVYLCADIGHGVVDRDGQVLYDNWFLFEYQIPYMAEFHIKNTDPIFNGVFSFSPQERERGIVNLDRLQEIIVRNEPGFPVDHLVGYLEMSGPKLGRDYADYKLRDMISESVAFIQRCDMET